MAHETSLYSIKRLEVLLGMPRDEIRIVASHAGAYYRPFVPKPRLRPFQRLFKPSKTRRIDNPTGRLKEVQKRIYRGLLAPLALPSYLHGGVQGRSIMDNVLPHFGADVLVTLDIRSFFPSITNLQVYFVWKNLLNCSPPIAAVLTKLTTFERRLPQGAPTSTSLANLVLHSVDAPVRAACQTLDVRYSTWVDDLAFSGKEARHVINVAVGALRQSGFSVSHRKMRIMARGTSQVLNGVLMGRFPTVVPERLSQIRSGIHKLEVGQVPPRELHDYLRSLEGRINHVAIIVPHKAKRLLEHFEAARMIALRG